MKLNELKPLLEMLQSFGVTQYETTELRVSLQPKPPEMPKEIKQMVSAKLTEDEMLFNPMKGLEAIAEQ